MIEYAALPDIILARDIDARLLVQPPARQPEIISDPQSLFMDDPVRHEPRIDIAGHAVGVVSEGHRGAANDENVSDDTSPGQALPQSSESALKFCPAKENIVSLAHAASRSRAAT